MWLDELEIDSDIFIIIVVVSIITTWIIWSWVESEPDVGQDNKTDHGDYRSQIISGQYLGRDWSYWTIDHNGRHVDPDSPWGKMRIKVIQRDQYACVQCGTGDNLTVHHKVPVRLGGTNSAYNLVTLCAHCHENVHQKIIYIANRDFGDLDNYGEQPKLTKKVAVIRSAIKNGTSVVFDYTDNSGRHTRRTVSPESLHLENAKVYMRGYCHLRREGRTFRVSRISHLNHRALGGI